MVRPTGSTREMTPKYRAELVRSMAPSKGHLGGAVVEGEKPARALKLLPLIVLITADWLTR